MLICLTHSNQKFSQKNVHAVNVTNLCIVNNIFIHDQILQILLTTVDTVVSWREQLTSLTKQAGLDFIQSHPQCRASTTRLHQLCMCMLVFVHVD